MSKRIGLLVALVVSSIDAVIIKARNPGGEAYKINIPQAIYNELAASHNSRELRYTIASLLAAEHGLKEEILAIKYGTEDQFPTVAADDAVVEATFVQSANCFTDARAIWFDNEKSWSMLLYYNSTRSPIAPKSFSAQYFEKLCSFEGGGMYTNLINFGDTSFSFSKFSENDYKISLTPDLIKFLSENASHFESLKGTYSIFALSFWLVRRGFSIFNRNTDMSLIFENVLRASSHWEEIRKQINAIRLRGDPEIL